MRWMILFCFSVLLLGCNKDPLLEAAPSMVGTWTHYSNVTDHHIIYINDDGSGKLEWYNDKGLYKETKERDWYIKENTLYFGKASFDGQLYRINDFPTTCTAGFANYYDSIPTGARYCKLDDVYYVELP